MRRQTSRRNLQMLGPRRLRQVRELLADMLVLVLELSLEDASALVARGRCGILPRNPWN